MKTLHVSAGGHGERIAVYIASRGSAVPKHLLPIPADGKTILGEIVRKAQSHFEKVTIWASKENETQIATLEKWSVVTTIVDTEMTGPLGPMVRNLVTTKARTFGCAGDFYCDFSWQEFEKFHDLHGLPISILSTKSVAAPKGARFHLTNGVITAWDRIDYTTADDHINIGCYIIDPVPAVLAKLETMQKHKEDPFFDVFVPKKLVAGYDPGSIGFNVNVADVYEHLLRTLT